MYSELLNEGYSRLDYDNIVNNKALLKNIVDIRGGDVNMLYSQKAIFILDDKMMIDLFGNDIANKSNDFYTSRKECKWKGYVIMPVYGIDGDVVALVGYNPISKDLNKAGIKTFNVYKQSSIEVYDKSRYLFGSNNYFQRALEEGYIILTDGVFDAISYVNEGFNAGALLGSFVSDDMIALLKMVPRVYLSYDNDDAGISLKKLLKRKLSNLYTISQDVGKDADDVLKSECKLDFKNKLKHHLDSARSKRDFVYSAEKFRQLYDI